MIGTITIDGKEYEASYKGITARVYREQFHSDLIVDLMEAQQKMLEAIQEEAKKGTEFTDEKFIMLTVKTIGEELLTQFLFASIQGELKLKGKRGLNYRSFVDNVEDYDTFIGACVGVYQILSYAGQSTEKEQEQETETKKRSLTYAQIVVSAMSMGLTLNDIEGMEIGMIFDLFISKNNMYVTQQENMQKNNKPKVRKATQEDFDRF